MNFPYLAEQVKGNKRVITISSGYVLLAKLNVDLIENHRADYLYNMTNNVRSILELNGADLDKFKEDITRTFKIIKRGRLGTVCLNESPHIEVGVTDPSSTDLFDCTSVEFPWKFRIVTIEEVATPSPVSTHVPVIANWAESAMGVMVGGGRMAGRAHLMRLTAGLGKTKPSPLIIAPNRIKGRGVLKFKDMSVRFVLDESGAGATRKAADKIARRAANAFDLEVFTLDILTAFNKAVLNQPTTITRDLTITFES